MAEDGIARASDLSRRQFFVSAGALATVGAVAGACGGGTDAAKGATGSTTLRYGESGSFTTLNPWEQAYGARSLANQIFSRLVYLDQHGKPVADLAKSWALGKDGKTVTLKLRSGVKWQDGANVMASDFVRMYRYLSDPALKSSIGVQKVKESFGPVTAVRAPDPTTVVMEFSSATPYYLDILDYWYLLRYDNPRDTEFLKAPPIGTGPFKLTNVVPEQGASLKAFSGYYVQHEPQLKAIDIKMFGGGSNVVSNLRSGLVDGVSVSDYAQVGKLDGVPSFYVTKQPIGIWLMQVNVSKKPFDNPSVRQALSYSLDREQIAKVAFEGLEKPVSTPFYAPTSTGYAENLVHAQSFNLAKAKSLIDGAGVKGLQITYPTPTSIPSVQTIGEIWQSDLAKIGITLKIKPVTQALWLELGSATTGATTTDVVPWNSGRSLQDSAGFWATQLNFRGGARTPLTRFGYHNPRLETLVSQGAVEANVNTRKRIYQQLNQILVQDAYEISFATFSRLRGWSSKVAGQGSDLPGNLQLAGAHV
ncbi:MAG: ABC transporter substrate-binding protein [Mycobacteriales bacterium]